MAEPIDDTSSTPSAIRCPWCSAELADPEATTCPSCQANLVAEVDKQLPGLTAVDLEKLAFRRALPQKKSRIMSWISGDMDYEDVTEPIAPPGSLDRPPIEVRREMLRLERAALIAELAAEAGAITADMVLDQETDPSAAAAAIQAHVDDAAAAEAVDTEVPLEELAAVSPEPTETEAALHAQADPDAEPDAVSGTLDSSAAADPSARGA